MTIVRDAATAGSSDFVLQHAFRRPSLSGGEIRGVAIQRRTVGTDDLVVVAEVEKNVRMIEWRVGAHAHELLRADLDDRNASVIVKVWNDVIGHIVLPVVDFFIGATIQPIGTPPPRRNALHHKADRC
jgi:hypothetical protein